MQVLESVRLGTLAKGVAAGALWSGSDKRRELARRGFARHVSCIQVRNALTSSSGHVGFVSRDSTWTWTICVHRQM